MSGAPHSRATTGGYGGAAYAACLGHVGRPIALPRSGLTALERAIPGTDRSDLVGPYPLLPAVDPRALRADLDELASGGHGPVSFVAVCDPLTTSDHEGLQAAFPDLARPFKRHFLADPRVDESQRLTKHHGRELRRARRFARFERCAPAEIADDWLRLYAGLIEAFGLEGSDSAFPPASLRAQLEVPGMMAIRAVEEDGHVSQVTLMLSDGVHGWYHLAAQDDRGRRHQAGFGALAFGLNELADEGVELVDLGGAAGLDEDPTDGLARYKSGFSGTASGPDRLDAWLIGAVLDSEAYAELSGERAAGAFFPAYRARG